MILYEFQVFQKNDKRGTHFYRFFPKKSVVLRSPKLGPPLQMTNFLILLFLGPVVLRPPCTYFTKIFEKIAKDIRLLPHCMYTVRITNGKVNKTITHNHVLRVTVLPSFSICKIFSISKINVFNIYRKVKKLFMVREIKN